MRTLVQLAEAVKATRAKYDGKPHDWKNGATCLHMVRFHLRQLGHRPEPLPPIRSLIGAKRALKQRGWAGMAELLDAQIGLERVTPAFAQLGDIAVAPSEDGIGAGLVFAGVSNDGRGNFLGWHEDVEAFAVMKFRLGDCVGVWRP